MRLEPIEKPPSLLGRVLDAAVRRMLGRPEPAATPATEGAA